MTTPISLLEKSLVEGISVSRAPLGNTQLPQITDEDVLDGFEAKAL